MEKEEINEEGEYQRLLEGLSELMKGKPKSFEVHHFLAKIRKAGERIGKTLSEMEKDVKEIL
jgi:hypothetical protein